MLGAALTAQVGGYLLSGHLELIHHHLHPLPAEMNRSAKGEQPPGGDEAPCFHSKYIHNAATPPPFTSHTIPGGKRSHPWAAPHAGVGKATWGPTWGTLAMCCRSVRRVLGTAPSPGSICTFTLWLVTKAQMTLALPGMSKR